MYKRYIQGKSGYEIPCFLKINGGENIVVVICHDFCNSKDIRTAEAFAALPEEYGIGAICFDFPGHGESSIDTGMICLKNCVSDLDTITEYAHNMAPNAEIVYFATGFGAYITLIYLSMSGKKGQKAFLRGAAVNMPEIIKYKYLPVKTNNCDGSVMLTVPMIGSIKVKQDFIDEFKAYDLFKLCMPDTAVIKMIHGVYDDVCSINDARKFAALTSAELIEDRGANHFNYPGGIGQAVKEAVRLYRRDFLKAVHIRELEEKEIPEAIQKLWDVFMEMEAPKCSINTAIKFRKILEKEANIGVLKVYASFEEGELVGAALMKGDANRLLFIIVDRKHVGFGISRKLFEAVLSASAAEKIIAYFPSFAVDFYRHLGFSVVADGINDDGIAVVPMVYIKP